MRLMSPSKKRRLTEFGRTFHVRARGLAAVLQHVRESGLPAACSASSVSRQRKVEVNQQTNFGNIIQQVSLASTTTDPKSMWVQHPLAILSVVARDYPKFAELLKDMGELQVVVYSDEITPGQQIKGNDRKCQALYWSLLNFGADMLCFEDMWFVGTVNGYAAATRCRVG